MKKIIAIILSCAIALGACACTNTSDYENLSTSSDGGHVVIAKAELVTDIQGADGEYVTSSSPAPTGNIYADVVVYVENMLPTDLDKSAITGSVLYDGTEYALNYGLENDNCTGVSNDPIEAYGIGILHLFAALPTEALEETDPIYAKVTVSGETCGTVVSQMDYREPISKKQELTAGESVSLFDGDVTITAVSCKVSDTLETTSSTPVKYKMDSVAIDAVLMIKNNTTKYNISNVFGYVINGSDTTKAVTKLESDDNLLLQEISEDNVIAPGETRVVHVYADYSASGDSKVRINLLGNCFYFKSGS